MRGLRGVYVSDRDGVPILCHSSLQPSLSTLSPGKKSAAPLDGAFALSADQISRLQFGGAHNLKSSSYNGLYVLDTRAMTSQNFWQCKSMCALYEDGLVVHVNAYPLVLTLVGDSDAHAEEIMAVAPRIQAALVPLQETIARSILD